jgi:F-type H+-transporting ATPase subunit b
MQIDWITVVAQIVNFLILVWLLNRFLYGPITRAMQRREEQIQSRLDQAKQENEKAEEKQREFEDKLRDLEATREEKLDAARKEVDDLKRKLEREAREDVDQKREAWLAELQDARDDFVASLRQEAALGFRDLADDALASLADTTLAERMADVLGERLKDLDGVKLERFRSASRKAKEVIVESGHALDANSKRKLTRAIHDILDETVEIAYDVKSEGLVGIRLRVGNVHLEWTLDDHLDQFAARLEEVFPARARKENNETGREATEAAEESNGAGKDSRRVEATHD